MWKLTNLLKWRKWNLISIRKTFHSKEPHKNLFYNELFVQIKTVRDLLNRKVVYSNIWPPGSYVRPFVHYRASKQIKWLIKLSVVSRSCRGFNVSKVPYIIKILQKCDILLLQETWLCCKQFQLFSEFFPSYKSVNVCGMDELSFYLDAPMGM